ncbi:DUF2141 domain-containing protein [uncultured Lacinutrix sp.]|uniref:DUF2141 domain-containing protein n=1 Tax=uncultured Lacinutrix sp. TaxID=574032 RepID=UPI00261FB324|nr:DUF2141 domain-containing protein [uncultured Lacinutrix sp.]
MNFSKTNQESLRNKNSISKILSLTILFTLFTILGFSQEKKGQTITVTIDNVKSNTGAVLLGLHDSTTFMKTDALQAAKSKIENNKITVTFKNVKPGEYAIIAVHDENENGKMDYESHGMPLESYGVSNNPLSYGPPQYNEAKFNLANKDLNLNIRF